MSFITGRSHRDFKSHLTLHNSPDFGSTMGNALQTLAVCHLGRGGVKARGRGKNKRASQEDGVVNKQAYRYFIFFKNGHL